MVLVKYSGTSVIQSTGDWKNLFKISRLWINEGDNMCILLNWVFKSTSKKSNVWIIKVWIIEIRQCIITKKISISVLRRSKLFFHLSLYLLTLLLKTNFETVQIWTSKLLLGRLKTCSWYENFSKYCQAVNRSYPAFPKFYYLKWGTILAAGSRGVYMVFFLHLRQN